MKKVYKAAKARRGLRRLRLPIQERRLFIDLLVSCQMNGTARRHVLLCAAATATACSPPLSVLKPWSY